MNIYDEVVEILGGHRETYWANNCVGIEGNVLKVDKLSQTILVDYKITKKQLEQIGELCDYEIRDYGLGYGVALWLNIKGELIYGL